MDTQNCYVEHNQSGTFGAIQETFSALIFPFCLPACNQPGLIYCCLYLHLLKMPFGNPPRTDMNLSFSVGLGVLVLKESNGIQLTEGTEALSQYLHLWFCVLMCTTEYLKYVSNMSEKCRTHFIYCLGSVFRIFRAVNSTGLRWCRPVVSGSPEQKKKKTKSV